jgi:hypothetical protein
MKIHKHSESHLGGLEDGSSPRIRGRICRAGMISTAISSS